MAVHLFHACNDNAEANVTEQFFYFYDEWQKSKNAVHLGMYFDMSENKFVFINGSNKNQLETVESIEDVDDVRGFGNLYSDALQDKTEHIRHNVQYY